MTCHAASREWPLRRRRAFAIQGIMWGAERKQPAMDGKRRRMRTSGGGDGTLHFWQVFGAGWAGEHLRGRVARSGDGDAGGGGVRGSAWIPVGAECAALLSAFAMEGCASV